MKKRFQKLKNRFSTIWWKFKEGVKRWIVNVLIFIKNNTEVLVIILPGILAFNKWLIKTIIKKRRIHEEEELKTRYVYDRSLGHYHHLRRTPKEREWEEIDRRKRNGESYFQILKDLRLL